MNIRRRTFLTGASAIPLAGVSTVPTLQLTHDERSRLATIIKDHIEELWCAKFQEPGLLDELDFLHELHDKVDPE